MAEYVAGGNMEGAMPTGWSVETSGTGSSCAASNGTSEPSFRGSKSLKCLAVRVGSTGGNARIAKYHVPPQVTIAQWDAQFAFYLDSSTTTTSIMIYKTYRETDADFGFQVRLQRATAPEPWTLCSEPVGASIVSADTRYHAIVPNMWHTLKISTSGWGTTAITITMWLDGEPVLRASGAWATATGRASEFSERHIVGVTNTVNDTTALIYLDDISIQDDTTVPLMPDVACWTVCHYRRGAKLAPASVEAGWLDAGVSGHIAGRDAGERDQHPFVVSDAVPPHDSQGRGCGAVRRVWPWRKRHTGRLRAAVC